MLRTSVPVDCFRGHCNESPCNDLGQTHNKTTLLNPGLAGPPLPVASAQTRTPPRHRAPQRLSGRRALRFRSGIEQLDLRPRNRCVAGWKTYGTAVPPRILTDLEQPNL